MIVVAAAVIVVTLIMQGMTLPWLLRKLRVSREDSREQERLVRLEAANAALDWLDNQSEVQETSDAAVASLRNLYQSRVRRLHVTDQLAATPFSEADKYRALRLEMLGVERAVVVGLRQQGRISATVLRILQRSLDLEEARLRDL